MSVTITTARQAARLLVRRTIVGVESDDSGSRNWLLRLDNGATLRFYAQEQEYADPSSELEYLPARKGDAK
jgi:hypothetical protein